MCSLIHNKKIECTECGQPYLEYKGDRGRMVACNCNCDMVLETTRRVRHCVDQETAGGGVGGMRRGMGELDRTGQGMLETYTRKLDQIRAQDWFSNSLSPKEACACPHIPLLPPCYPLASYFTALE